MENTKELNFEDLDKIVGGTRLEACPLQLFSMELIQA